MRTRLSGVSAWTVGLSTAIAALAAVTFQVLGYLNLRVVVTILAAVAVAVLGWLAQRSKLANDKRQSWNGRMSEIEQAVAIWPLRRVKAISDRAFDAGVYPVASEPPTTDDSRTDVGVRLQPGEIVLIVGPAGCGKSTLALKLLRDQIPDAWLIVPEDAEGLASLLSLDPPFGISPGQSAVLLLDGCERFLSSLELGALDALRAAGSGLFVVATIRDDELGALLQLANETGYIARRFVARASVVPMADTGRESTSSAGEDRHRLVFPLRQTQAPLIDTSTATTEPSDEPSFLPAPPRSVPRDWGVRALVAGALALAGAFVAIWLSVGFKQPAPVAAQLTSLTNEADTCGVRSVYPPASADAISADQPVVVVTRDAGRCHARQQSDKLSVFAPVDGNLTQVYAFQPAGADGGIYQFRCSGTTPGDPCLTNITGTSAYAITGAFTNTNTLASYPIEILRAGGGFTAEPLQHLEQTALGDGARAKTLTDGATSISVVPTSAYSVIQPIAIQPPVYVAGEVTRGSFDSPRALKLSAWSPSAGAAQVSFDHECRPLPSDETVEVSFVRGSGDFVTDLGNLLKRYWTRVAKQDGESCP